MLNLLELFWVFIKIGLFTVGGGYAMIPLIQQEILDRNWLTLEGIIDIIAISEMTPGPFAVNAATFIGIQTYGIPGALAATAGVIFPSFILVILIANYFTRFKDHPVVQALLSGLRPAVIGLIAAAAFLIGKNAFYHPIDAETFLQGIQWRSILIFVPAVFAIIKYKMHPAIAILLCGVAGILLYGFL